MARSINAIASLLAVGAFAVLPADAVASNTHPAVGAPHSVTRAHAKKKHHASVRTPRRASIRARCATGSSRRPRARRACRVRAHRLAHSTPARTPAATSAPQTAATTATPCQNTELTPEAGNIGLVRAAVLCLINRERSAHGEQPLALSAQLETAAQGHAAELVADDYFAHVSPSGETPSARIRETGYIPAGNLGYVIGENLAWGTLSLATPKAIVEAWVASPPHLENILEAGYRDTGIGVTAAVPASLSGGSAGATYAQEFGTIIR